MFLDAQLYLISRVHANERKIFAAFLLPFEVAKSSAVIPRSLLASISAPASINMALLQKFTSHTRYCGKDRSIPTTEGGQNIFCNRACSCASEGDAGPDISGMSSTVSLVSNALLILVAQSSHLGSDRLDSPVRGDHKLYVKEHLTGRWFRCN